jgi:hypothetical protein
MPGIVGKLPHFSAENSSNWGFIGVFIGILGIIRKIRKSGRVYLDT